MSDSPSKKIPKTIKFGAYKYTIETKHAEFLKARDDHDEDCVGLTVFKDSKIYLNTKAGHFYVSETLLHELCHIAYYHGGLQDRPSPSEEDVVNVMSFHLLTVLKDNPKLREYLFAGD